MAATRALPLEPWSPLLLFCSAQSPHTAGSSVLRPSNNVALDFHYSSLDDIIVRSAQIAVRWQKNMSWQARITRTCSSQAETLAGMHGHKASVLPLAGQCCRPGSLPSCTSDHAVPNSGGSVLFQRSSMPALHSTSSPGGYGVGHLTQVALCESSVQWRPACLRRRGAEYVPLEDPCRQPWVSTILSSPNSNRARPVRAGRRG